MEYNEFGIQTEELDQNIQKVISNNSYKKNIGYIVKELLLLAGRLTLDAYCELKSTFFLHFIHQKMEILVSRFISVQLYLYFISTTF